MKKIFIIAFSLFSFISASADARQGCCSHHGGVQQCDTNNGRLLCNDNTYSPSCKCEYSPKQKENKVSKKAFTKKITPIAIQKNYNCQTMVITERLASYYKTSDTSVNLGAIIEKTKIVKTGNFINNMFEVKIVDTKDRVWIKKESCGCL